MGDDMSEWISVDDKLPDASGNYLTFNGYDMKVNQWNKNGWLLIYEGIMITHWMPLPDAPTIFAVLTPENRTDYEIQT